MKIISAEDFGIKTNQDITEKLFALIKEAKKIEEEKTVVFPNGTYYIDAAKCEKHMLYITNTVADEEYSKKETPHENTVAFYFHRVNDIVFDGGDSKFIIDGKLTNAAIVNCKNITFKNLEIIHRHPHMHDFTVANKTKFYVDFKIDNFSKYSVRSGKMYFFGSGYTVNAKEHCSMAYWTCHSTKAEPNKVVRDNHPLLGSYYIKELKGRTVRAYYRSTDSFNIGDTYTIYDSRRQFAGIYVCRSKNVVIENIKQRFSYSLALVLQDTENVTVENLDFSPEKTSGLQLSSVADFIQICMCRGKVSIKNSNFEGAGDDCLNIHGVHFKIIKKDGDKLFLRFMHPQTHGFNPLHVDDEIAYINPTTLLETGRAKIKKIDLINETDFKIRVTNPKDAKVADFIEDISACPELDFIGNTINRIPTRGVLVTNRRNVTVKDNHFISTSMSGVLLSDDASSWYESGMCENVKIENNIFDYCGETPILIKPENRVYKGAVHKNINIIGNTFKSYNGSCIDIKDSDNIVIADNNFLSDDYLKTVNCHNVDAQ